MNERERLERQCLAEADQHIAIAEVRIKGFRVHIAISSATAAKPARCATSWRRSRRRLN